MARDTDPYHRVQVVQTPTGPLALVRPIAQKLLAEGVISGTLDGYLHAADAATVKAAMIVGGVCDFCSAHGIEHDFDVPDFDMPGLPVGAGRSTDGWAACGPCGEMIKAGRRKDLFKRSTEGMAFSKFTKPAIQALHDEFWKAMEQMSEARGMAEALADFVADTLPDPPEWHKDFTGREARIAALSKVTGLTVKELDLATSGEVSHVVATKLLNWGKRIGAPVNARTLADLARGTKPLAYTVPHWQEALDSKFEVLALLHKLLTATKHESHFPDAVDLNNREAVSAMIQMAQTRQRMAALSVDGDYRALMGAQVYSFNAETEAAIMEAAQSVPHDAPLSAIETPHTGGWFWFSAPLAVPSSPAASDTTHALLWSWVTNAPGHKGEAALMFSAYVKDDKQKDKDLKFYLYPSTRWHWPLTMSFHEMLAYNLGLWREQYGPGGALEHDGVHAPEAVTTGSISSLSLFFVMACLWFRQTVPGQPRQPKDPILTQEPGHIERHARKRYQREHKLAEPPTVQVVALRRSVRTAVDPEVDRAPGARAYSCRWIVKGHSRLQACGPGRKDRKLIWIEAHPAGPEDQPFKAKPTTVFAVVR